MRNIHIAIAVLGSFLCLHRAPAAESSPHNRPTLRVPVTDSNPVVDGKLDEPCWNDAAKGGGAWSAEFALPFDVFAKNKTLSSRIGFNIIRSGMPAGETHCGQRTAANPGEWGVLTGVPARESLPRPDYSTHGLNRFYHPVNRVARKFLAEEEERTIPLGPGSAHPGTTG